MRRKFIISAERTIMPLRPPRPNRRAALLASAVALLASGTATAEPLTHDGFFLRGEVGPGYLTSSNTASNGSQSLDYSVSGPGVSLGLFLGGTPWSGIVIGGGLSATIVPDPKVEIGPFSAKSDSTVSVEALGPFIQYFPNPLGGFNAGLMLGIGSFSVENNNGDSVTAYGWSLSGSVGYEWWVGYEWSLGLVGRLTYARTSKTTNGVDEKLSPFVPSILFAFTYH